MIKNAIRILLIPIFSLYLSLPSLAMDEDIQLITQATRRLNQKIITLENENNVLKGIGNRSKYNLLILKNEIKKSFIPKDERNELRGQSIRASLVFGVSSIYHNEHNLTVEEGNYFTVSGNLNIPNEGEEQILNIPEQAPIYGNKYSVLRTEQIIDSKLNGFLLDLSIGEDLEKTLDLTYVWIDRYASLNGRLEKQD